MITICKKCKHHRYGTNWQCFVPGIDPVTFDCVSGKITEHAASCHKRNTDGKCESYKRRWWHCREPQDFRILD